MVGLAVRRWKCRVVEYASSMFPNVPHKLSHVGLNPNAFHVTNTFSQGTFHVKVSKKKKTMKHNLRAQTVLPSSWERVARRAKSECSMSGERPSARKE